MRSQVKLSWWAEAAEVVVVVGREMRWWTWMAAGMRMES